MKDANFQFNVVYKNTRCYNKQKSNCCTTFYTTSNVLQSNNILSDGIRCYNKQKSNCCTPFYTASNVLQSNNLLSDGILWYAHTRWLQCLLLKGVMKLQGPILWTWIIVLFKHEHPLTLYSHPKVLELHFIWPSSSWGTKHLVTSCKLRHYMQCTHEACKEKEKCPNIQDRPVSWQKNVSDQHCSQSKETQCSPIDKVDNLFDVAITWRIHISQHANCEPRNRFGECMETRTSYIICSDYWPTWSWWEAKLS